MKSTGIPGESGAERSALALRDRKPRKMPLDINTQNQVSALRPALTKRA
jgi:hypothetical protein